MAVDAGTESGARYHAEVRGRGDPGYAATAVMLGQSGLAVALDGERLPDRAGSLTPATALGTVLADRLRAAGHIYEVAPADRPRCARPPGRPGCRTPPCCRAATGASHLRSGATAPGV